MDCLCGLTLIALGIHCLVWHLFVTREMSDWGEEDRTDKVWEHHRAVAPVDSAPVPLDPAAVCTDPPPVLVDPAPEAPAPAGVTAA